VGGNKESSVGIKKKVHLRGGPQHDGRKKRNNTRRGGRETLNEVEVVLGDKRKKKIKPNEQGKRTSLAKDREKKGGVNKEKDPFLWGGRRIVRRRGGNTISHRASEKKREGEATENAIEGEEY